MILEFYYASFQLIVFSSRDLGVYDALQKKYLKTLMFCICESVEGPMIEEYSCKFWRDGLISFVKKCGLLLDYTID